MQTVPVVRIITDGILIGLLWLSILLIFMHLQPFERGFYCSDTSIRYPFKKGTISSIVLYSVGALLPAFTIVIVEAYRIFFLDPRAFRGGERIKPSHTICGKAVSPYLSSLYIYLGYFFFGMAVTIFVTDVGKYTIGRLRPHFLDVCKPNLTELCTDPYAYVPPERMHCTGKPSAIRAARLSFPSGHSSTSAYTMVFLVLYLQSRMIWSVGGLLFKHILQLVALLLAVVTGLSRVSDFKHHWSDVLAGSVLGIVVAFVMAYAVVGMFRRPQSIFASPSPYGSRNYSGGQLYGEFNESGKIYEHSMMTERSKEAA